MSWRTLIITGRKKCDYQMGYIVVRDTEEIRRCYIGEIGMIIIESTAVSITTALLCELVKAKVKVVFCDEKHNPLSELLPYYGSHDTSVKVREQIAWNDNYKKLVWTEIISEKIRNQRKVLSSYGHEEAARLLDGYIDNIEFYDETNREGHAAKVYFNALFGKDFSRSDDNSINASLNYGYGMILSMFNREVVANGYITQLGLFHSNMYNQFNLSCDLMEPFRPFIDRIVLDMMPDQFERGEKRYIIDAINNTSILINDKSHVVPTAIKIYCKSVFDAISQGDVGLLKFYKDEL